MTRPATCRCGHTAHAHEHYRAGTECGLCDCTRYGRRWFLSFWHRGFLAGSFR